MATDTDPPDRTKEELADRVQHLEQELKRLQGGARSQKKPPKDNHAWLVDIAHHLLTEHNNTGIDEVLATLGNHFKLNCCDFRQWQRPHNAPEPIAVWRTNQTPVMEEWVDILLTASEAFFSQLARGDAVTFNNSQLTDSLRAQGIRTLTLVPVQSNHKMKGFMALLSGQPEPFSATDLEQVQLAADLAYGVHRRQQAFTALADRDTRFQYAMEASRDGLWDWNIETGKIYFSRSYLRMLGYEYDALPGTLETLRDYFLHPEDAQQVLTQYHAAIDNHRAYMNLEYRMLHQSGSELWIYSRAKFVEPNAQGRPSRCVGINANITDFIHSQEALLAAKTQADMANKTKGEFLARMSHEIRTPMNAIIGLGHLLQDTELDEQQQSYLGSMTTAAESLLHIINQVLDFSKIETGKIILENSHFDLDQIFEKLSRLFEISALHKAVKVIYDIGRDVPRFLRGDASRLSQVISHLITNALQYSASEQVVVGVTTTQQNSQHVTLEFTITDFGVGLDHDQLSLLQKSLRKNTHSEVGSYNNQTGFGLSICNHLVGLMHGQIHIDSTLGAGCKISFTARFEHSHIGAKSLHDQPHALSNLRALIVDDNAIARNIIASTAHSIRLHADTTDSAKNALNKIYSAEADGKPYHLVLMDYNMPLTNGLQATNMIKSDASISHKPLIFLISSYHQDEIFDGHNSTDLVDGFISKPVSESRLFDIIHQAIHTNHPLYKLVNHQPDSNDDDLILENLRVLLAEDNIVNQQVAQGILRKKGVEVSIANNGQEAIDALHQQENNFDMILMDLEMPELDGYQATMEIRNSHTNADIPIIAITAQAMRGDRERCLAAGMNAYLTKPIQPDLLYRTLADIMRAKLSEKNLSKS